MRAHPEGPILTQSPLWHSNILRHWGHHIGILEGHNSAHNIGHENFISIKLFLFYFKAFAKEQDLIPFQGRPPCNPLLRVSRCPIKRRPSSSSTVRMGRWPQAERPILESNRPGSHPARRGTRGDSRVCHGPWQGDRSPSKCHNKI